MPRFIVDYFKRKPLEMFKETVNGPVRLSLVIRGGDSKMHRKFRQLLGTAEGHSEFIIVVIVDVRGFSKFSKIRESPETAMYIRRVYMGLIDEYFGAASFYKPTGDGLLVVIPYTPSTLKEVASKTVKSCLECYKEFAHICDNDHMVNFDVPREIGIGIARGNACRLESNDLILDYSGHILNLASRLLNLARPSGIVIDGDFTIELLYGQDKKLFKKEAVYIRGISEEKPKTVHILKDVVSIPPEYLQALTVERWKSISTKKTFKQWKELSSPPLYRIRLKKGLRRTNAIRVTIIYPLKTKEKDNLRYNRNHGFTHFHYRQIAGKPTVTVNIGKMLEYLKDEKITSNIEVQLRIEYLPAIL